MDPRRGLLVLALAARPLAAQTAPSFQAELAASASYEGTKTEEPLVIVGGAPSTDLFYRADSVARSLGLSGVAFLRPVADDGATPLALLPFVARVSSARAELALEAKSSDSYGISRGRDISLTSELTGDESPRSAGLTAEWFFDRATAARGSVAGSWQRATEATRVVETPSGRGELDSLASRSSGGAATLGLARRFGGDAPDASAPGWRSGFEAAVAVDGGYRWRTFRRTDQSVFSAGGFRTHRYELASHGWSIAPSATLLLFARRVSVELAGSYESTRGDLDEVDVRRLDSPAGIARAVSGTVTWYPCRRLGLFAGASYATRTDTSGLTSINRVSTDKANGFSAGARVFCFGGRASASVRLARLTIDTIVPPGGATYQMLRETRHRVDVTGAVRF